LIVSPSRAAVPAQEAFARSPNSLRDPSATLLGSDLFFGKFVGSELNLYGADVGESLGTWETALVGGQAIDVAAVVDCGA